MKRGGDERRGWGGVVRWQVSRLGGSGTDYAGFLSHMGIACLDMGYADGKGCHPPLDWMTFIFMFLIFMWRGKRREGLEPMWSDVVLSLCMLWNVRNSRVMYICDQCHEVLDNVYICIWCGWMSWGVAGSMCWKCKVMCERVTSNNTMWCHMILLVINWCNLMAMSVEW